VSANAGPGGQGKRFPAGVILAVVLAVALGGVLGFCYGKPRAPFGALLPPLPKPLFMIKDVEKGDNSVLERRAQGAMLKYLAPQPDGLPPFTGKYHSERGMFSLRMPVGADVVVFTEKSVSQDGIDSQIKLLWDQPVQAIQMTFVPRQGKASFPAMANSIYKQMENKQATGLEQPKSCTFNSFPFERILFTRKSEGSEMRQHAVYVGPFMSFVLTIDFMGKPEAGGDFLKQAEKFMATYTCERPLNILLQPQDPGYQAPTALVGAAAAKTKQH
jgi:hypothetical protein